MSNAWTTIPHVTHFDEIEIDHILNLKKDIELITDSKKVSILTFISYALIKTLTVMKKFNSTADIDNQVLIIKNYVNLGIAVDTPEGLVVPNIKNIEKKSVKDINDLIIELSDKARSKKLTPNDLSKGTFTISSLGGIGGKFFTPIINYPEVAIMGISRAYTKIKLDSNNFPFKVKILPFSLSYDHRVIDGAEAARFCNLFKENLKNLSSL
jgi:pyruvate dehydrogenase E2 component (dihydrolipoamide acetyltransferase)